MSCPIFTVINEDGDVRVTLVDDNGVGNAIPTVQGFRDLDIRHDYVTGDVGKTAIRLPHEFTLSMDYVTQEVREKLLGMKFSRDRVTLADPTIAPENPVFGWRPAPIIDDALGSETAYDLTGNTAIKSMGSSNKFAYWNRHTHKMSGPLLNRQSPLIRTVHGEAYQAGRHTTNRSSNPYPESATQGHDPGEAGWYLGDGSGIATLTHITDGFDNSLCPDTLRIRTAGAAGSISLTQSAYFTPGHADDGGWIPPSSSTCWGCVWIKGTLPPAANIEHGPDGNKGLYDISGMDLSQWTRIDVGEFNATYSEYNFAINITCAAGEVADFQVGPTMVCIEDTSQAHGGPGPFTAETNHTVAQTYEVIHMQAPSFDPPQTGTATCWFSIEEGNDAFDMNYYREMRCAIFEIPYGSGGGTWDGNCWLIQNNSIDPDSWRIRFVSTGLDTFWEFDNEAVQIGPGLHSVSITWGSNGLNCYYDGEALTVVSGGVSGFNPGPGVLRFAGGLDGPYTGASMMYHGFSILSDELPAEGVAAVQSGLLDTVSKNLCDTTKGRLYEIVSVPSIPLIQDGFTRWMGDIRFKQVKYDGNNPAWFAEEL